MSSSYLHQSIVDTINQLKDLSGELSAHTCPPDAVDAIPAAIELLEQMLEPVRIYDYVWTCDDDGAYNACYTPGNPVAAGVLFAVVHPSQLHNAYLQRSGFERSDRDYLNSGPLTEVAFTRKGWGGT